MATGIGSPLALGGLYPSVDGRYVAANGKPFTSVSNAESALNGFPSKLSESCVGLTVLVADENDPDYPKAKEYWVQPKGTTPETYGLVEKGAGTTDYADLDNKPTISDGGQGSAQIPLAGNVKVTASTASGETAGVTVTQGQTAGEIEMQFTLPKGADGANGATPTINQSNRHWMIGESDTGVLAEGHNPNRGTYNVGDTFPSDGIVGDYIVVVDNSQSTPTTEIYKWDVTQNDWEQTGVSPNDAQFEDGELLPNTKIDNTALVNPASNALAKATDVMGLAAKLEGVTATEDKVTPTTTGTTGTYIKPNNTTGSGTGWQWGEFALGNAKAVRFVALDYITSTKPSSGWLFLDSSNNILISAEYTHTAQATKAVELVVEVPDGATTFKTNIAGGELTGNFYCYLQSGESVGDIIRKGLYGYVDESIVSENNYASNINSGDVVLGMSMSNGGSVTRGSGITSRCGYLNIANINPYKKLKIIGNASLQLGTQILFTKKSITELAAGTYTYQDMKDGGFLCDGITADNWISRIPYKDENSNGVIFDIPPSAAMVYIKIKQENGSICGPSSVIPFGQQVQSDVEKIIEEKIGDFTPIEIIDNLNSDNENAALSANQGKIIGDRLSRLSLLFFEKKSRSFTSGGVWSSTTDYGHSLVPVKKGEAYRIYNYSNNSDNIRYAFLTSEEVGAGEAMPLVDGTSVVAVAHSTFADITIPEGCKFLTFTTDNPSTGTLYYFVRLYKYVYFPDKEFLDDELTLDESIPINAISYHEQWDELVEQGYVTRSAATYMSWDSEQKYPIYTYRIRLERDWMSSSYYINQNTDYNNPFYYRRKIMVTCGIHGNERVTPLSFLKWVKTHINDAFFAAYDFVIIPLCNPWGYSHTMLDANNNVANVGTSNNANSLPSGYSIVENSENYKTGIRKTRATESETSFLDINRDFVDELKFQTEEAQYIRDVFVAEKPNMVFDFHQDFNDGSSHKKCGFVSIGASVAFADEWQEIRRKAFVCIDKANHETDSFINKGFANKKQFSFSWGHKENPTSGTSGGVWKNYAAGGIGNTLHQDCAARFTFTFETDAYCVLIGGSATTINNSVAKNYGYIYMTNFLKYIFDVFNMQDLGESDNRFETE